MNSQFTVEKVVPLLNPKNLRILSPLGRGAKGVVFLVKDENDDFNQWALKVIYRERLNKRGDGDALGEYKRVIFERQVLSHFDHPLLPRLRGVLRTENVLGYAIDYCPGRDLNFLRKSQTEGTFSIELIRFYAAEMLLGLGYLHSQGIAYRDLKPENVMIQENGHIMLVDFDLSTRLPVNPPSSTSQEAISIRNGSQKRSSLFGCWRKYDVAPDDSLSTSSPPRRSSDSDGKSNSFVGTEEYVAPEIIRGNGHGFEVDWWSYGVVLYEMLYGVTPFKGSNRKETFLRILTKEPDLVGETTPLRDLIRKLLVKEPAARIGLNQIKAHVFFAGVEWDAVMAVARPPYIPPPRDSDSGARSIEDMETFVCGIFAGEQVTEREKPAVDVLHHNADNTCLTRDPHYFPQF